MARAPSRPSSPSSSRPSSRGTPARRGKPSAPTGNPTGRRGRGATAPRRIDEKQIPTKAIGRGKGGMRADKMSRQDYNSWIRAQNSEQESIPLALPNLQEGEVRIGLLTAAGLSKTTHRELSHRKLAFHAYATTRLRGQDLMAITINVEDMAELYQLQTVEDIFILTIEGQPVRTPDELKPLARPRVAHDIQGALTLRRQQRPARSLAVFVKQDKDRDIYRKDIAATIEKAVGRNLPRLRIADPGEAEVWAFFAAETVTVGVRLTSLVFRQRNYRKQDRPGALRPVLAAALVEASLPREDDIVLDPICGTGTLLLERSMRAPAQLILGGDRDTGAVHIAQKSAASLTEGKRQGPAPIIHAWDATDPAAFVDPEGATLHGRVTCILANLPFGMRFAAKTDLSDLYADFLEAWAPLMAPRHRAIVLTPETDALKAAAHRALWNVRPLYSMDVQGTRASVVQLTKIEE